MEEIFIAATSAMTATLLSNPLEVVKTRFQLQGELRAKGLYTIHYKNFFHAIYVIAKVDGLSALQKGLVPALWHQLFMNGIRLSGFQIAEERKWNQNSNGEISLLKTSLIAAAMGAITAYTGSPFYLVKIQLQAQSSHSIAVGTQHAINGTFPTLRNIYKTQGLQGLWRGCTGSLPRRCIGSATQLSSFTVCKDLLANNEVYSIPRGYLNSFVASMIGGIAVTAFMCPLDTISTRLYNQGVDSKGKGILYSSYLDCVRKMYKTEGLFSFYKGVVPFYIRTGPHTVLVLVIWDALKDASKKFKNTRNKE